MNESTKLKLIKTFRGALIAGSGVAVTFFLEQLAHFDFGAYSAVVGALSAVLINAFREAMKKYEK